MSSEQTHSTDLVASSSLRRSYTTPRDVTGADYAYAMIVRQNLDRAFQAWDHIQPWWRYFSYLAADFFPWSLLLPAAIGQLLGRWRSLATVPRFTLLAWAVPFVLLSFSASKQGKYLLMGYPFLALTVALGLQEPAPRLRAALRTLMAAALSTSTVGNSRGS